MITRKDFLRNTSLAAAGLVAGTQALKAHVAPSKQSKHMSNTGSLTLSNVRLETGFRYELDEVVATETGLFNINIRDGRITDIQPYRADANSIDMKGKLMLPAFSDIHIHLDKTFYGGPWQATRPRKDGVKGMIALEQQMLPELLKTSTHRAEKLIELLQSKGTSFARSHVNIEPTSKLDSLKNLEVALASKKDGFTAEIVAFPQHGIFYTDSAQWMKEAAAMDIDFIGGVDPHSIDGSIERAVDFMVQLALEHNKGIDLHLHEGGESGLKTVEYLIKKVNENPVLKGKTFLSHCFVLARIDKPALQQVAESLAAAEVGIASTIPFGSIVMPIPTLLKHGVNVLAGNDSIIDHWNTFGSGSVLQKANVMAELYGYSSELALSRCLRIATQNIMPLDDKGAQQWPKVGDAANLSFLDASCSAEAVARISPVTSLIHNGNLVF